MAEVSATNTALRRIRAGSRALRARAARRRSARRGPRCAHRLPPRLNRRQNKRGGSARRGGSTAGLGSRSCVALGGAARPLAPRNRGLAPTDRGDEPPAERAPLRATRYARSAPLDRLHGRRDSTPARAGFRCAAPTVPALRAPIISARKQLRCAARRFAPCAYASRSAFRSFVAALRARAAARYARLAPGLAPGANPSPHCARLNSPSPGRRTPRRPTEFFPAAASAASTRRRTPGARARPARQPPPWRGGSRRAERRR